MNGPWVGRMATALATLFAFAVPLSISGMEIALGGLLLLWAAGLARGWWRLPKGPVMTLLLLLAAWKLVAVAFAADPLVSLKAYRSTWSFLAVPILVTFASDPSRRRRLLRTMTATMGIVFVYACVQFFTGVDLVRSGARKVVGIYPYGNDLFIAHGTFDHHLTFANSAMMGLLLMAGLALAGQGRWRRLPRAAILCAGLFALIASASRGPWMGLAAGLVVMGFLVGRRGAAILGISAVILIATFVLLFPPVARRALSVADRAVNQERIYLWESAVAMIRDNPVTGIGPGLYSRCTAPYRARYDFEFQTNCHAHNTFLQVAVETGLPGLALFLALLAAVVREAAKLVRGRAPGRPWSEDAALGCGALLAVTGFAVAGLTQHNFGDMENVYMLWFIVGMTLAARAIPLEEKSARQAAS